MSQSGNQGQRKPTAIVLEPTKDLAEQTHTAFGSFSKHLVNPRLTTVLIMGGINPKEANRALMEGVDIVTGTPGGLNTAQEASLLD